MAAKSTSIKDIKEWIDDVIVSCKTIEQCESTRNLIENFQKRTLSPNENRFQHTLSILHLKTILGRKITELKNGKEVNH